MSETTFDDELGDEPVPTGEFVDEPGESDPVEPEPEGADHD
jgi:hypothetical protein